MEHGKASGCTAAAHGRYGATRSPWRQHKRHSAKILWDWLANYPDHYLDERLDGRRNA